MTRTFVELRAVAITLALAATMLTSRANAQQDPPPAARAADAPSADAPTPLSLRPSKHLELAQEPPHTAFGWKVVAVMAILGGAAFALRKRVKPKRTEDAQLTILRRTAIGLRSELLIVNVEGQRLLIGVTPHAIQSLAVLDADERPEPVAAEAPEAAAQPPSVGERFAAMLSAADGRAPSPSPAPTTAADGTSPAAPGRGRDLDESLLASQARGLMALRRRG